MHPTTILGRLSTRALCLIAAVAALATSCRGADNITDLQRWNDDGLPANAVWAVDGHTASWHVQQVQNGHRLMPSVKLHDIDADAMNASNPTLLKGLESRSAELLWFSDRRLGICLRTDNIRDSFTKPARWTNAPFGPGSPRIWRQLPDGRLDSQPYCDSLAPVELWRGEGQRWANTPYVTRLQQLLRSPSYVMFVENNEGSLYEDPKNYRNLALSDLRSISVRLADSGIEDLSSVSLDIYGRRETQYEALFDGFRGALTAEWQKGKFFTAAYRGLERGTPGLGGFALARFGTYNPSFLGYDTSSPPVYIQGDTFDLTSPALTEICNFIPNWECERKIKPNQWRELSVSIDRDAIGKARAARRHEDITPAVWGGWCTTLAWLSHERGVAFMLRHWDEAATKPDSLLYPPPDPLKPAATNAARKAARDALAGTDRAWLLDTTVGDYELAEMAAVDRICDTPGIREYWLKGSNVVTPGPVPWASRQKKKPVLDPYPRPGDPDHRRRWLNVSCNTPTESLQWAAGEKDYVVITGGTAANPTYVDGQIKVWAVATELDGRWLLWAFTPCEKVGTVTVTIPGAGDVSIDMGQVPYGDYWVVEPAGVRARKLEN